MGQLPAGGCAQVLLFRQCKGLVLLYSCLKELLSFAQLLVALEGILPFPILLHLSKSTTVSKRVWEPWSSRKTSEVGSLPGCMAFLCSVCECLCMCVCIPAERKQSGQRQWVSCDRASLSRGKRQHKSTHFPSLLRAGLCPTGAVCRAERVVACVDFCVGELIAQS